MGELGFGLCEHVASEFLRTVFLVVFSTVVAIAYPSASGDLIFSLSPRLPAWLLLIPPLSLDLHPNRIKWSRGMMGGRYSDKLLRSEEFIECTHTAI